MRPTIEFARVYCNAGLAVLPLPRGAKTGLPMGWQNFRIRDERDLERLFCGPRNIAILLGEPSGGAVDVDLDCAEAIELAPRFLPPRGCIFGREGKPRSHYILDADPLVGTRQFRDPTTQKMIAEFRSTGAYSMFPGSEHPSGELVRFDEDDRPARVDGAELRAAVGRLAAAVLERRYPRPDARTAAVAARWRGEAAPAPPPRITSPPSTVGMAVVDRARRYLASMAPAIEGSGGNATTYRAALSLVRGFALEPSVALDLLVSDYNPKCRPPWEERDLAQKVESASRSSLEAGYLLGR